jgi:hypothetical protein
MEELMNASKIFWSILGAGLVLLSLFIAYDTHKAHQARQAAEREELIQKFSQRMQEEGDRIRREYEIKRRYAPYSP